ncbi:MAG: SRPBCC family protein [Gemmatimonadales bacterium]
MPRLFRSPLLVLAPAVLLAAGPIPVTPARLVQASDSVGRAIRYRVDVAAAPDSVWQAWTSPDHVREWFAPAARIELRPLGRFEILFAPDAPPGQRGAENNLVLAVQPPRLLSFTWDAPPHLPEAREQRTSVTIRLQPLGSGQTRVWFEQTGWGDGGQWDQAFQYFMEAWKSVLALLQYRFARGPVDWSRAFDETRLAPYRAAVTPW